MTDIYLKSKRQLYLRRVYIICISIIFTMILSSLQNPVFADTYGNCSRTMSESRRTFSTVEDIDKIESELILKELGLKESELSNEERLAILTRGTATVWDSSYENIGSEKKTFTMTANLTSTGTLPYTVFTIKNTGKSKITVVAYTGETPNITTLYTTKINPGSSKTFQITRAHILKYGRVGNTGTTQVLLYKVSLYNDDGKNISFTAKATRYY